MLTTTLAEHRKIWFRRYFSKYLPSTKDREDLQLARSWIEKILLSVGITEYYRVGSSARGTDLRGNRELDYYIRAQPDQLARLEGLVQPEIRYRTGGFEYYHVRHAFPHGCYRFDIVPISHSPVTADRAILHQKYMSERLTPELLRNIIEAKALLKRVGLYDADEKYRGFSGWAVQVIVERYGSIYQMPPGHTWESCPIQSHRNVLASLSSRNLLRFYRLRLNYFKSCPLNHIPSYLYIYEGREKIENHPLVRSAVRLRNYLILQLRELDHLIGWRDLPASFFDEGRGFTVYSTAEGYVKKVTPQKFIKNYNLIKVHPEDTRNIKTFNFFR